MTKGKQISIRLGDGLQSKIEELADKNERSLSNMIRVLLRKAVERGDES